MRKLFELVVLSGKGGTGKTSVSASLAALAGRCVIADCDVDAADLHLVLSSSPCSSERFVAGHIATLNATRCTSCGKCFDLCRFGAVKVKDGPCFSIDSTQCEGCGVCVRFCPAQTIDFKERDCGELMVSDTRFGPMSHARLKPGGENSGKMVSAVKEKARELSKSSGQELLIVDGPPGIGCPVIASVSGASLVLLVTEPTLSAEHDLLRAIKLLKRFQVPGALCVNRWDINPKRTEAIERAAQDLGIAIAGRIRYDAAITKAQIEAKAVVETDAPSNADFYALWSSLIKNEGLRQAADISSSKRSEK